MAENLTRCSFVSHRGRVLREGTLSPEAVLNFATSGASAAEVDVDQFLLPKPPRQPKRRRRHVRRPAAPSSAPTPPEPPGPVEALPEPSQIEGGGDRDGPLIEPEPIKEMTDPETTRNEDRNGVTKPAGDVTINVTIIPAPALTAPPPDKLAPALGTRSARRLLRALLRHRPR